MPEAGAEIPDSPVGERLTWVLDYLNLGATELTPEMIEENFAPEFLTVFPADHLLHHLGRQNVEAIQEEMGHGDPLLNVPMLSTRDLFALKTALPEDRAEAYVAASPEERREMLEGEVAEAQLSPESAGQWLEPRWIDEIEWFASTEDLARAMTWLDESSQREGLEPIREILSMNP